MLAEGKSLAVLRNFRWNFLFELPFLIVHFVNVLFLSFPLWKVVFDSFISLRALSVELLVSEVERMVKTEEWHQD